MKAKKLLAILTAVTVILSLASCVEPQTGTGGTTNDPGKTTQADPS
jgi:hypothetical protein